MGTSGSFKIVRTTASYFFSPSGHGKWAKAVFFFAFLPITPMQIFKRYIQICHMKADVLPFLKMWWFLCYNFLNRSYCCSKSGQIWSVFLGKLAASQKKYALKFFSRQILLREFSKLDLKTSLRRNCLKTNFWACIYFFWRCIILMTNSKFQTPLTLNSHKSAPRNNVGGRRSDNFEATRRARP